MPVSRRNHWVGSALGQAQLRLIRGRRVSPASGGATDASDGSERVNCFLGGRLRGRKVRSECLRFAGLIALLVVALAVAGAEERAPVAVGNHRFQATAFLRFEPQSPYGKADAASEERAAQLRYLAMIILHNREFFESEVKAHGLESRLGGDAWQGTEYKPSHSALRLKDSVEARLSGTKELSLSVALDDPSLSRQVLGWLVKDLKTSLEAEARDMPDGKVSSSAGRLDTTAGSLFQVTRYSMARIERTSSLDTLIVAVGLLVTSIASGLSLRRLRSSPSHRRSPPLSLVVS